MISAEDGAAIDVAHLFRREQLPDEALLAIGAHGALAAPKDLATPSLLQHLQPGLGGRALSLGEVEQQLLREALAEAQGNVAAAARRLGLTRAQLAYRLKQAGGTEPMGRRMGDGQDQE